MSWQVGHRLTSSAVEALHTDGYLSPLDGLSPLEVARFSDHFDRLLNDSKRSRPDHNRHLDDPVMLEFCRHPALVGALTSVLGSDVLLWRTNFFDKQPGGLEVPWHQDGNFWPLEPALALSAWVALDRADVSNSCVQVVPGTHRRSFDHAPTTGKWLGAEAVVGADDVASAVDVALEPGQFFLFNERILHRSSLNASNRRRRGLAVRVIIPQVRVMRYDSPQHTLIPLSGGDALGFNRAFASDGAHVSEPG